MKYYKLKAGFLNKNPVSCLILSLHVTFVPVSGSFFVFHE